MNQRRGYFAGFFRMFQRGWVRLVLFFLFRGLRAVVKCVPSAAEELNCWEEGFVVSIGFLGRGPELILQKCGKSFYRLWKCPSPDLEMRFKSLEGAFDIMSFRKGINVSYAQNQLVVSGEIAQAMSVVRLLNQTENYLLPSPLKRDLFSEIPEKQVPSRKILWAMATDFEFFPRKERPRRWKKLKIILKK